MKVFFKIQFRGNILQKIPLHSSLEIQRKEKLYRKGSYHGVTLASLSNALDHVKGVWLP